MDTIGSLTLLLFSIFAIGTTALMFWAILTIRKLRKKEEQDVSKLSDAIAAATDSADAAIGRVQDDVAALEAKIADLEKQIEEGSATQDDLDNLAALKAKLDALDPTKPDTL